MLVRCWGWDRVSIFVFSLPWASFLPLFLALSTKISAAWEKKGLHKIALYPFTLLSCYIYMRLKVIGQEFRS